MISNSHNVTFKRIFPRFQWQNWDARSSIYHALRRRISEHSNAINKHKVWMALVPAALTHSLAWIRPTPPPQRQVTLYNILFLMPHIKRRTPSEKYASKLNNVQWNITFFSGNLIINNEVENYWPQMKKQYRLTSHHSPREHCMK